MVAVCLYKNFNNYSLQARGQGENVRIIKPFCVTEIEITILSRYWISAHHLQYLHISCVSIWSE